ncbi:MAG TPA: LysR family transcriptional regulator [Myxococcales bacterium]
MELHQLQCFVDVVEKGGFRRATAGLEMTQPALSYQIKQLEDELGVALFHRRAGGVAPTEAGRVFLEHARAVIAAVREAHRAIHDMAEPSAELRIGCLPCIGTYFIPDVIQELQARHPTVRPKLCYGDSAGLLEVLIAGQLEAALVADAPPDPRVRQEIVMQDRISLISGPGHPFHRRPSVAVQEVKDVQLVMLSTKSSTGALIRRYLDAQGVNVQPVLSSDDPETLKMLVEEGMGATLLPDMATRAEVVAGGGCGPLWRSAVEPLLIRNVILVTRSGVENSPGLDVFVQEVRAKGKPPKARRGRAPRAAAAS